MSDKQMDITSLSRATLDKAMTPPTSMVPSQSNTKPSGAEGKQTAPKTTNKK